MSTKNQQIDVELNEYVEEVDRTFSFVSCHETLEAKWMGPNFKATIQHSVLKCWLPFLLMFLAIGSGIVQPITFSLSAKDHAFAFRRWRRGSVDKLG